MPFREHPLQFFAKNELKAREQQKYVLDQINANWDKYKYFFLSLPTGVGKTFIACSIADAVGKAYILTSSLQLQDQYQSSWDKIVNLKGRGNYECRINPAFMVDSAPCTADKSLIRECRQGKICDYYNQKDAALASQAMITNPVYFLYSTHCGFGSDEAIEDNPWIKRDALIIDEAHNIEDHLASFAGAKIDPKELYETHGAKVGHYTFNGDLIHDYETCKEILVHLRVKAQEYEEKLESEFPSNGSKSKEWARALTDKIAEKVKKLNTKIYALDKSIQPLNIFFGTHDTLDELNERWLMSANLDDNTLQLSPLRGGFLFKEYMGKMADKFIMLSATLGTKKELCAELDLDPADVCFIETDTPFPAELSPIIAQPKLKLGYKDLQSSLPKIAPLIEEVLDIHSGEKGIIHCIIGSSMINMANGSVRAMHDLKVGDLVRSWSEEAQCFESQQVEATMNNGVRDCIELTFEDGRKLTCTADHRILTKNRGYVPAGELTVNDDIIDDYADQTFSRSFTSR